MVAYAQPLGGGKMGKGNEEHSFWQGGKVSHRGLTVGRGGWKDNQSHGEWEERGCTQLLKNIGTTIYREWGVYRSLYAGDRMEWEHTESCHRVQRLGALV